MAQEKRISDTPCSALEGYGEGPQRAANGQDSWGRFKDEQGLGRLDAGSRVGFISSRPRVHGGTVIIAVQRNNSL